MRAAALLTPFVASFAFVHFASLWLKPPLGSLWLYLGWWFGLSLGATVVLFGAARLTRRLLPLAALLKLSLVFPDETPSRLQTALRAGGIGTLEQRLALVEEAKAARTPRDAARILLELISALDAHDRLTRGHSERVRGYAVLIGKELGLRKRELDLLNWAALLHDVGKLEVAQEILTKAGRPTDEEWESLRRHPLFGEELAAPLRSWLAGWSDAIGHHHERWDGKGYPRGLSGEAIPLPGRIVAVADVFDVITSARTYKEPGTGEEGRREIARCAGTQFDPAVVRAFLNVSLGRMRAIMGPLSWLSHAPLLGRLPLTPAIGTFAGTLSVVATATASGALVHVPAHAGIAPSHTQLAAVTRPALQTPSRHVGSRPVKRPSARATVRHSTGAKPSPPIAVPVIATAVVAAPAPALVALSPPAAPAAVTPAAAAPTPALAPATTTAAPAEPTAPTTTPQPAAPKPPPTPKPPAPPAPTKPPPAPTSTAPAPQPAQPAPSPSPLPTLHLAFVSPPSSVASGAWTSIRVAVEDDANQVVTSDNSTLVTLDLAQNPAGATLTCMNVQGRGPVAVQNGIEDFVCSIDKAGAGYALSVADSTNATGHPYAQAVSNAFTVTAGPPAQVVFSGEPTGTTSGATVNPAVEVTVEDAAGNPVAGDNSTSVTVALGSNPGGAALGGTLTQTVHNGVAAFADLSLDKAGVGYTLTAASSPATSTATSTAFDVAAGAASQLVFSTDPTTTTAGATISPAVQVSVEDSAGNTVATDNGTTVTLALGTNPGGGTLGGTLTQTVQNGVATFADLTLDIPASGYTLSATSSPTTATATSTPFDVALGAPAQLVFSGQPTNTSASASINPAVQLTVEDSAGNVVVTDNTTTVTVAVGANPGGSTLGGTLTQTVQNGVATFADLTLDNPGAGYTLTATSTPSTASVSSAAFDVGAPAIVSVRLLTSNASHPCTSGTSCTTSSFTATPGATLLVLAQRGGSTKNTDNVTAITGPVLAPLPVASVEYPKPDGKNYLFAWTATAIGLPGSVTVDFAPGTNANPTIVEVVEVSGVNPLIPIAQSPTAFSQNGNATATLAAPDNTNGELLLVSFLENKPIAPPLGFGTVDTFQTGSNGGEDLGVYFAPSAQPLTTVIAPGGKGWGTIALELAHS